VARVPPRLLRVFHPRPRWQQRGSSPSHLGTLIDRWSSIDLGESCGQFHVFTLHFYARFSYRRTDESCLARSPHLIPIPGARNVEQARQNAAALTSFGWSDYLARQAECGFFFVLVGNIRR
jgi:hypothetical protein